MLELSGIDSEKRIQNMVHLFTDNDNWVSYYIEKNRLWIKDYPQSEMHGGGPSRLRNVPSNCEIIELLIKYISSLEENNSIFTDEPQLMKVHLECLYNICGAYISNTEISKALSIARAVYGRSFLPGNTGNIIESKFWDFANKAHESAI